MSKKLRNNMEVCHVWASRSQDEGYCGNISFRGNTLYSYGWYPIANFIGFDHVLITNFKYSKTTAHHIINAVTAIPDFYKKIYVLKLGNERNVPHKDNLEDFYLNIKDCFERFSFARERKRHYFDKQQSLISQLLEYCELFNLQVPEIEAFNLDKPEFLKKLEEWEKVSEDRQEKLIEKYNEKIKELESKWILGETNATMIRRKRLLFTFSQVRLRVSKDKKYIETSMGAYVGLPSARVLYNKIKKGEPIHGHKIDYYTVVSFNGEWLKIGCHNIHIDEINRIVKQLNW